MSLLYKLLRFERAGLADGKELLLGYNEDIVAVFFYRRCRDCNVLKRVAQ